MFDAGHEPDIVNRNKESTPKGGGFEFTPKRG